MARISKKMYRVHASGVYLVEAADEAEARKIYRESKRKIESADSCVLLASYEADDSALFDAREYPEIEEIQEDEAIIDAPEGSPENLIIRALKRMSESEKGGAWDMIRRYEMALKLKK